MTLVALGAPAACVPLEVREPWRRTVREQAGLLGHGNWVVVAEASFPAHSRKGVIQTAVPVEVPDALDQVLRSLELTEHVRPRIFLANELGHVGNEYAPGIGGYRAQLEFSLHGHEVTRVDHKTLLTLLEDAKQTFNVLVVRTQTALPYSSVFIELQHGYWDGESESRLREKMRQTAENPAPPGAN
jgi:L-fucose mutarotase/ribose pyranase (RbsD/FucU family)